MNTYVSFHKMYPSQSMIHIDAFIFTFIPDILSLFPSVLPYPYTLHPPQSSPHPPQFFLSPPQFLFLLPSSSQTSLGMGPWVRVTTTLYLTFATSLLSLSLLIPISLSPCLSSPHFHTPLTSLLTHLIISLPHTHTHTHTFQELYE